MSATPDLLEAIVAATRARVDAAMTREPRASVERRAMSRTPNAAGFIERGPPRTVGTVRPRRSAASSDSTLRVQRPSAARSRPSSLRLVTSSSTSNGFPPAHS